MFGIGYTEMGVILIVAILLFGKRLPEVAKNVGASYQQFRQGLADIQTSITTENYESSDSHSSSSQDFTEEYEEPMPESPQFVPPADDE